MSKWHDAKKKLPESRCSITQLSDHLLVRRSNGKIELAVYDLEGDPGFFALRNDEDDIDLLPLDDVAFWREAQEGPESCPNCGCLVLLVNNSEIYGKEYGKWPYAYKCIDKKCDSYVGLHPYSDEPLGNLADQKTRNARKKHKRSFFSLQKERGWSRGEAYKWLQDAIGMKAEECHWGLFNADQCRLAGDACKQELCK